jgi:DNA-binding CsgD family transcriptional regulator/PAS domain-containing protein
MNVRPESVEAMIQEDALDAVIADVYEAPLRPDNWASVVGWISDRLRGAAVICCVADLKRGMQFSADANNDPQYQALCHEHYGTPQTNPAFKAALLSPPMTIVPRERFLSDRELLRDGLYNDTMRPQNLWHGVVVKMHADNGSLASLNILRGKSAGSFGTDELELLAHLLPHLNRALRLRQRLGVVIAERDDALRGLEALAVGVALVDAEAKVLFANAAMERILRAGDGLAVSRGRLVANPAVAQSLARAIGGAGLVQQDKGGGSGGEFSLPRRTGHALSVLVSPLRREQMLAPGRATAMVVVSDPDLRMLPPVRAVADVYGLTPAEARLTMALLAGRRLADYAAEQKISLNTAKYYLKEVFTKTGHTRQADLLRDLLINPVLGLAKLF